MNEQNFNPNVTLPYQHSIPYEFLSYITYKKFRTKVVSENKTVRNF